MKSTTAEYRASMAGALRERSYVELSINISNEEALADGDWTHTGLASYTYMTYLTSYAHHYANTVATLELNRWTLDGTQAIYDATRINDGYASDVLSDMDGTFASPPTLTCSMTDKHDLNGFTAVFDSRSNEWPLAAEIDFYDGGSLITSMYPSSMKNGTYMEADTINDCDGIIIQAGTVLPYTRFRVQTIAYGLLHRYYNKDVTEVYQSQDIDPLSRRLPQQTLEATIVDFDGVYDPENPQGITPYLMQRTPVSVCFGYDVDGTGTNIEWLSPDKYILDSDPVWTHGLATITATKLIGKMLDICKIGAYGNRIEYIDDGPPSTQNKTLYNLAVRVLTDANLPLTDNGNNPWNVDNSLKTMYTTGILPKVSHAECLQYIAHAACCRLYCDDDDIIHIEPVNISGLSSQRDANFKVDNSSILERSLTLSKTEIVKNIDVYQYGTWMDNIFNGTIEQGSINDDTGAEIATSTRIRTSYIPLSAGVYTISYTLPGGPRIAFDVYDMDKQILPSEGGGGVWISGSTYNFVLNGDRYVRFVWSYSDNSNITPSDISDIAIYGPGETIWTGTVSNTLKADTETDSPYANYVSTPTGYDVLGEDIRYARATNLSFDTNNQTVDIKVTAIPVVEEIVGTISQAVNTQGEDDVEDNPLITSDALANAVKSHVNDYLTLRNTYQCSYRGNPELQSGDVIGLQTRYMPDITVLVLACSISFNGALRGEITAKGLS